MPQEYNETKLKNRVVRALSAVNKSTVYKMGRGGFNPQSALPHDFNKRCDCSGFVAWCIYMGRDLVSTGKARFLGFGWIETSLMYRDAMHKHMLFTRIEKPVPGCIVVYPDRRSLLSKKSGHTGVVVNVEPNTLTVVDCSSSNSRIHKQAIRERNGNFFIKAGAIFILLKEDLI